MEWWEKLYELRSNLSLKQGEFAKVMGITQKDLSLVEKGKKRFVPEPIIRYLLNNEYDLNSFFNRQTSLLKLNMSNYQLNYKDALVRETGLSYDIPSDFATSLNVKVLDEVISNIETYRAYKKFEELRVLLLEEDGEGLSILQRIERLEAIASATVLKNGLFTDEEEASEDD